MEKNWWEKKVKRFSLRISLKILLILKKKKIILGFQVKGLKINIRKFEIFFVQNT